VRTLGERLEHTIRPLLSGATRAALLDVPTHQNVGDSAIHLGTLALLRRAGVRVCYACSIETYSRDTLARRLGDGVILLSGGGSLGDLWPLHQQLREQVLADFPNVRVIQLPQSLHFRDRGALSRARVAFGAHRHLTLLLRDDRSLAAARSHFDAPSEVCPDLAFALGPLPGRSLHGHGWCGSRGATARPRRMRTPARTPPSIGPSAAAHRSRASSVSDTGWRRRTRASSPMRTAR